MDKILRILLKIEHEPDISQRQLAKTTGYSLGSVNGILQKLIDGEEIISKPLTPNHYVYEITAKGHLHKGKLLYDFVIDGYDAIGKVRKTTKATIESAVSKGITNFFLYGQEDPIYRLVKMSMIEYKRKANITYSMIDSFDDINTDQPYMIIVWNKETLELEGPVVNVLIG